MSEEFFKTTLISKYIKYLLSYTPLPLYPVIEHDQYMIKGCTYIHKDKVLKCTESGIFSAMLNYETDPDYLRVNSSLKIQDSSIQDYITLIDPKTGERKTSPLVVTDKLMFYNKIQLAKYKIINDYTFGDYVTGLTQHFVSNTSFYDSETHKVLGDYLRLIRNQYNLDLMSLYNCYNYENLYNVSLNKFSPYVIDKSISNRKLLLVPIKFNTIYTVALDCDVPILIKGLVYKNNSLVLDDQRSEYISNLLSDTTQQINKSEFDKPFIFSIENKERYIQQFENCLYMAIQVPYNLSSTLTVLEGDYRDKHIRKISDIKIIKTISPIRLTSSLSSKPSLLTLNDKNQHPFSDKLISYLLRNTMDEREYIDDNVANIEKKINYNPKYQGMWDTQLRYILFNRYMDAAEKRNLYKEDIFGFVDKDIEEAVRKGYIKYGST